MFGRQGHNNSNSSNLVEFRAGRMNMIGRMVHPDTRKGLVYLTQSDDGLMHFCWKDRTSGKVEDDLIVFPDEYDFQRVEQCKTGRVYVLKFKTSTRRMFFWMQEPKTDKDDEHCRRVNELMNNPPSASSRGSGGGSSNSEGGDLQYMLNNISQQQLMQLFGGVGQMGGLSSLLGSMNRAGGENSRNSLPQRPQAITLVTPENSSSSNATRTPSAPKSSSKSSKSNSIDDENETSNAAAVRSLNAIPNTEPILEITADPAKKTQTLSVHLPESYELDEEKNQRIKETVSSAEFEKALSSFAIALQSSAEPIVTKFELTPDAIAAAYAGNLKDFNKALENALPNGVQMVSIAKDAAGAESTSKGVEKQNTSPASPEHADNNKESTE